MPHLDTSTYTSQIFWLMICFFSMMFIMSKFIIPKIAEIRQQRYDKLDGYLHKAEELQKKTENAIQKYEEALSDATKKANLSLQSTKDELNELIKQKQFELDKKLQSQIKAGEAEVEAEKIAALKEIKSVSTILAIEILQKLDISDIKKSDIKYIIEHEAE